MAVIPKVTQVPIQQPIAVNNLIHPIWVFFFESLAKVANENAVFSMQKMKGEIVQTGDDVLQISIDISDMNALITAINTTLLGVDKNIIALQGASKSQADLITSIQKQIENINTSLLAINSKIGNFETRIARLESKP